MATVDCGYPANPDLLAEIGPALEVSIGCDPDYVDDRHGVPRPQVTEMLALVDTGASECFIDASLAAVLKLPIVDRQTVTAAHGLADVNVYLAQIHVPALDQVIEGYFAGVQLLPGMSSFVALIGRSFLREFTMSYEGRTGRVTLSDD